MGIPASTPIRSVIYEESLPNSANSLNSLELIHELEGSRIGHNITYWAGLLAGAPILRRICFNITRSGSQLQLKLDEP